MDNLWMDAEDQKELLKNYAAATSDMRFIKNGYSSQLPNASNKGAEIAYLVSFVHPEVSSIYQELSAVADKEGNLHNRYAAGRPYGFPKENRAMLPGITFDTLHSELSPSDVPNNPDGHPLCRMLDNIYGGVLLHVMEGDRKGETETAYSNRLMNNKFIDIYNSFTDSKNTTEMFLANSVSTAESIIASNEETPEKKEVAEAKLANVNRIKDAIDEDSLFGYKLPKDANGNKQQMDKNGFHFKPATAKQWERLKMCEHIFYATVLNTKHDEHPDSDISLDTANSVFAFTVKLSNFIYSSPSNAAQRMLSTLDNVLSGSIQEQANDNDIAGELNKRHNIGQLAAFLALAPDIPCGPNALPLVGKNNDSSYAMTLLRNSGVDEKELAEYANVINEFRKFKVTSAGEKRKYKVGPSKWSINSISPVIGKLASGEYSDSSSDAQIAANDIYRNIIVPIGGSQNNSKNSSNNSWALLSDSVRALPTNLAKHMSGGTYWHPLKMVILIGNILNSMGPDSSIGGLVSGLTPDASGDTGGKSLMEIANEVGTKANTAAPSTLKELSRANDVLTPAELANATVNDMTTEKSTNPLQWTGQEMSVLDPDTDDVSGAMVAPARVIPLFCSRIPFPSSDSSALDAAMYKDAIALSTYMVMLVTNIGSSNARIELLNAFKQVIPDKSAEIAEENLYNENLGLHSIPLKVDIKKVVETVEHYLRELTIVSTDVGNAIAVRNNWIDAIQSPSWNEIAKTVLECVQGRNKPESPAAFDEFKAKYDIAWMEKVRDYVLRYVFEVKKGSGTVKLDSSLSMADALPLEVINKSEYGRLRLTGGAEDSVTDTGKDVLKYMHGTVLASGTDNNSERTYSIQFESGKIRLSYRISENETEHWIYPQAVVMVDPGDSTPCYAVWQGVRFIAVKSMESGPSNTYRKSDDYYGISNEVHMSDNAGSSQITRMVPSVNQFVRAMGTASPRMINEIRDLNASMVDAGVNVNHIEAIANALTFMDNERSAHDLTRSQIADVIPETLRTDLKLSNLLTDDLGASAIKATRLISDALLSNVAAYSSDKSFAASFDAVKTLEMLLEWVRRKPGDSDYQIHGDRLMHILHALGFPAENRTRRCGIYYPFVIVSPNDLNEIETHEYYLFDADDNLVKDANGQAVRNRNATPANNINIDQEHVFHPMVNEGRVYSERRYPGIDEIARRMRDVYVKYKNWLDDNNFDATRLETHDRVVEFASMYNEGIDAIKDLIRVFMSNLRTSIPKNAKTALPGNEYAYGVLRNYLNTVAFSQDIAMSMKKILEVIEPYAENNPLIMQRSLSDILIAMKSARTIPMEINLSRHQDTDYNKGYGRSDPRRVTGHENDELLGDRGENEYDRRTSEMAFMDNEDAIPVATDSIDEDALHNLSNENARDFEQATSCEMLGHVILDTDSYQPGTDILRLDRGISPAEFKKLAAAIDSAHEEYAELSEYAPLGNAAISAYEKNTDAHDTITRIVEGFYNFMVSRTPIFNRNIKDEATAIKNHIDSIVAKANVPMVSKAIEEVRDYFGQLVNGLNSRDEVEGYGNDVLYDDAHRLATAAANIILKLDTYQRTELVSDKTNGLGKFSDFEHRPSGMDDMYALSGMLPSVTSDGSNRIVTDETKNARKNVFSSHITDLGQRKEYAETLASIYNTLGMGDTMGFRGALIPEQDILSKLENKAIKETRKLYNDVIDNDLSAAFVYMLMADERANNARYGKVSWFIKKLLGQVDGDGKLHAIDIPEYVFSGVGRTGDTDVVRVTFNKDGSRTTDEVVTPFADMVEISLATGEFVPAAGGETTEVTPEMVMAVVNAIRTKVIGRMLVKNPTLARLKKLDSDTAKPIYRDRVEAFEKAIYASAGQTIGQQGYMPLSLLYGCVDYGAVEDAMKAVADSSDVALKNRQLAAQSNAIMKRIFGNHYSDAPLVDDYTMQGMVPERLKSVLKVALPEMCKTGEALSIKTSRALNVKDDSGTNLISLFKGQRDAANEFITMCMDQIPMENAGGLGADEISEIADNIVDKIFAVHSSTENSEWFNDIANAMAKSATGDESRDAAITEIGKIINPSGNMNDVAERILHEYEDAIRTYRDDGKVINKSVCKNLAIDVLDRIYNRDSAFRREYILQHGSSEADDLQAYINMHGNSPITDANYIRTADGEIGGASVLHQKVYGILAKNNEADAEMLKDLQFSIGKATGGAALDKFNELVADLCDKLDALYTSTIKFAKASLGAKTPKAVMAIASNKIGDNPRDIVHAGHARKNHLKVLESTIQYIKEFLSYSKPKDKVFDLYSANVRDNVSGVASWENNPIDAFVNDFLKTFCDISQPESREAIAQWDAKFGNKKDAEIKAILDKLFSKLRKIMALEFAYDSSMYTRGAESLANAAGGARGVYTPDVNETDQEIIRLIDKFSKISYFPIKLNRHDSDVLPEKSQEYLIEGNDATREEAIAVMKSAMQKYFEETGETDFNKADFNIDEFIECVKQSTSFKPEVQMGTEGITRLLINTLKARNLIKISPMPGCVRINRKADISKVGKKKDGCIFDIPAGILYSIVDDALRDTRFTGSGNEWEAFSRELSRLTLKGARELDKQLGESNFQNQLIKLFRSVNDTRLPNLLNKVVDSLTNEERMHLLNNGAVTTPEGIRIAMTRDAVDNPKFGDDEDNRIALLWKNPDTAVDYDIPDEPPAPPAEPHGQPAENPGDDRDETPEAGRNPENEF